MVCLAGADPALQGPCPADQHMAVVSVELPQPLTPPEFMLASALVFSAGVVMHLLGRAVGFADRNFGP